MENSKGPTEEQQKMFHDMQDKSENPQVYNQFVHEGLFMDVEYDIRDAFRFEDIDFTNPSVVAGKPVPIEAKVGFNDTSMEKADVQGDDLDSHHQRDANQQKCAADNIMPHLNGDHIVKRDAPPSEIDQGAQHTEKIDLNMDDHFKIQDMQVDLSVKHTEASVNKFVVPVSEFDSSVDPLSQLVETQWHELTARAAEVVKNRVQTVDNTASINEHVANHGGQENSLHLVDNPNEVQGGPPDVPDETPQLACHTRNVSKFKKSPFINETCSQLAKRRTFRLIHPLLREIRIEPDFNLTTKWGPWIDHKAIAKSKVGNLYPASTNNLYPKFNFGVHMVDKKEWFHVLNYGSKNLSTSHLDVLFYYLRKKAKYDQNITVKVTTTDCQFDSIIRALYNEFMRTGKDMRVVDSATLITEYISGRSLRCNTPWVLLDDILFPVMVVHDWHWILARLSLKDRSIYVYDSKPGNATYNEEVIQAVEPYATMLPLFLSNTDFIKRRPDLFYSGSPYEDKSMAEPFILDFSPKLPSLMKRDYGVFAAAFAEYYIQYQCTPTYEDDLSVVRSCYAMYLWHYGMSKQMGCAVSDEED